MEKTTATVGTEEPESSETSDDLEKSCLPPSEEEGGIERSAASMEKTTTTVATEEPKSSESSDEDESPAQNSGM